MALRVDTSRNPPATSKSPSANSVERADWIDRYFGWLIAPADVPRGMRRYVRMWLLIFPLGSLVHFVALSIATVVGVWPIVWFNLFSVPFYLLCVPLLRRGFYRLPLVMMLFELASHGWVAQLSLGPESGLSGFIIPFLLMAILQPFWSLRDTFLICAAGILSMAGLVLLSNAVPPLYELHDPWTLVVPLTVWLVWAAVIVGMVTPFALEVLRGEKALEKAWGESESLLLNILPAPVAARLKKADARIVDRHERVAILFADIVGFTSMADRLRPDEVVALLDELFNAFDELAELHGIEKIKTIGDAWMAVSGAPLDRDDADVAIARLALDVRDKAREFKDPDSGLPIDVRIGLNAGRVVAGVIGKRKFAYDLWGDAVNVAARMESTGRPGCIQVPAKMAEELKGIFELTPRGEIDIKGKGVMRTFWLDRALPHETAHAAAAMTE